MKDIELPPLPEPTALGMDFDKGWDGVRAYGYTEEDMDSYARAAVEADRAQRVPDGWKLVPVEPTEEMLNCGPAPANDAEKFAADLAAGYRKNIWAAMLASTPAPAQQEPMEAFLVIDLSRELGVAASELIKELRDQGIGNYSVNMALPKSAAAAMRAHFKSAAQHQEPSQQERKPMTPEQVAETVFEVNGNEPSALFWRDLVRAVERHHGIKE